MLLVFVHGWSVRRTDTYGGLPEALQQRAANHGLELEVAHVFLGRYISFHDEVTLDDISRGFEQALRDQLPDNADGRKPFSCITHSTGGPVVRNWVEIFYGADGLDRLPLKHLIMLAPANHGSALAQLGRGRLSRIRSFFRGVEPGQGVLDWLELGSEPQCELNLRWLEYRSPENGFFPFVLTGQQHDPSLYDHLNAYTGERGSDGVVRVCAANMNYRYVHLRQTTEIVRARRSGRHPRATAMEVVTDSVRRSPPVPLGVLPETSHSGDDMGIMRSVTPENADGKLVVREILRCLQVADAAGFRRREEELRLLTRQTQEEDYALRNVDPYMMVVFRLFDDYDNAVNDYDLLLLAGSNYDEDDLPRGFFVDRQRNQRSPNTLTYYLNAHRMRDVEKPRIGFRVIGRPTEGFASYTAAEFRAEPEMFDHLVVPNETILVDLELHRQVDRNIFRLDDLRQERHSFKGESPNAGDLDPGLVD